MIAFGKSFRKLSMKLGQKIVTVSWRETLLLDNF